jgi:recombination protein RecA
VLGGGYPLGRVVNIVGDKAVGKTLLAIEAAANFANTYPKGHIWYREAEAAFDEHYARRLGLPVGRVDFGPESLGSSWDTVEDIFEDLERCLDAADKSGAEGLYIIDSLDALSTRAELGRKIDEGTYGLEKPKLLGQLLKRLCRRLKRSNVCLIVISQVRDKIGITFGDKHTRSGGKALDFYASQILYLSHRAIINSPTVKGAKRAVGVRVRAKSKKNKIVMPFRECEFVIKFGYGIDDVAASLDWLIENKMLSRVELAANEVKDYLVDLEGFEPEARATELKEIREIVVRGWAEVESRFEPKHSKY